MINLIYLIWKKYIYILGRLGNDILSMAVISGFLRWESLLALRVYKAFSKQTRKVSKQDLDTNAKNGANFDEIFRFHFSCCSVCSQFWSTCTVYVCFWRWRSCASWTTSWSACRLWRICSCLGYTGSSTMQSCLSPSWNSTASSHISSTRRSSPLNLRLCQSTFFNLRTWARVATFEKKRPSSSWPLLGKSLLFFPNFPTALGSPNPPSTTFFNSQSQFSLQIHIFCSSNNADFIPFFTKIMNRFNISPKKETKQKKETKKRF